MLLTHYRIFENNKNIYNHVTLPEYLNLSLVKIYLSIEQINLGLRIPLLDVSSWKMLWLPGAGWISLQGPTITFNIDPYKISVIVAIDVDIET